MQQEKVIAKKKSSLRPRVCYLYEQVQVRTRKYVLVLASILAGTSILVRGNVQVRTRTRVLVRPNLQVQVRTRTRACARVRTRTREYSYKYMSVVWSILWEGLA